MTRRQFALASAAAMFIALVVSMPVVMFGRVASPKRLDVSGFAKVRVGMTEAEIEGLMGMPAGDHGSLGLLKPIESRMAKDEKAWCDDEEVLFVSFDGKGEATAVKQASWNLDPSIKGFLRKGWRRFG